MDELGLRHRFDAEDRDQDEFPLLPFEVPSGVSRIHVSYDVDNAIGSDKAGWEKGNIIDIGIFDPRGAEFPGGEGFRGWSGTTVNEFTIGPTDATPGYVPGEIQPGTWNIVLGLYQLHPLGANVRISIRFEEGAEDGPNEIPVPCPYSDEPFAPGPRWFRGDLHSHSHHSDGTAPLTDLVLAARAQGLDFVVVTEHNTVSHLPYLGDLSEEGLLLIPGMEISTYHGHANVWPLTEWVDFRCWQDEQMSAVREQAREQGALFTINHPKDQGPDWRFGQFFNPDLVEVWGGPWFISNYQSLNVWDQMLRHGKRVTCVGGSDKHQTPFEGELGWYELGTPTTWVWAKELSIPAIVEGMRAGNVFVSEGPDGPRLEFSAELKGQRVNMGGELGIGRGAIVSLSCRVEGGAGCIFRLESSTGVLEAQIDDDSFAWERDMMVVGNDYFRPTVIDPPEAPLDQEPAALMARALGNPVYMKEG